VPGVDPLLTGDQAAMVEALDALCVRLVDEPYLARTDREARFPVEVVDALTDNGWSSLVVPEEYGGGGADIRDILVVLETLAVHSLVVSQTFFSMWLIGAEAIAKFGTDDQRGRWLPRIAVDGAMVAFALTEPGAGSDAAALTTSGVRGEGGWRITGQKVFITGAAVADTIVTAVRTEKGPGKRHGITVLLVDPKAPGVRISKLSKMGLRGLDLCEVFLDDVFVPDDDVLGQPGEGWSIVTAGLALERVCLAAISAGALRNVLDLCLAHALQRETFGRVIGGHQMIGQKLVEMRVAIDASRGLVKQAAQLVAVGDPSAPGAASVAKLYATRAYAEATREGVQVFGGYGFTDEYPVSRHYRDCKYLEIGGGSSEIQTIIVGRAMGLPL
jgi:alkylation response protein AidB-like acyl-CoA dehydrogenase